MVGLPGGHVAVSLAVMPNALSNGHAKLMGPQFGAFEVDHLGIDR